MRLHQGHPLTTKGLVSPWHAPRLPALPVWHVVTVVTVTWILVIATFWTS